MTTIRVLFNSEAARNRFYEYVGSYDYRAVYNNREYRPYKETGWAGDSMGSCRLYIYRRTVINFERLGHDIANLSSI